MKKIDRAPMAVFFYGFIIWLIESATAEGITKLYFFTREGVFFKNLYEEVAGIQFPERKLPAAEILEVSRMSTFLPSFCEISLDECMRIWNQYETQSMAALMRSFHTDLYRMRKYFAKYRIDPDEKIVKPWEDRRVQALFQDEEFVEAVAAEKEKKKRLLCSYLAERGFSQQEDCTGLGTEKDRIGVVDIGWKGTIQDNLCYLYPDSEIVGFYIGLQQFLSPQPSNSRKYGYINAYALSGAILMFVSPLEMLCNSPTGSVLAYAEKDGRICAVKRNERQEDAVFFRYTARRQQKIAACMRSYCCLAKKEKLTAKRLHKKAVRALYRFIVWPDRKTADVYFTLKHNEEFGMGCFLDKRKIPCFRKFLKTLPGLRKKGSWKEFLKKTTWPQGYFVKHRRYLLLAVYNVCLLYDMRIQNRKKQRKSKGDGHYACKKNHIQICD